MNINELTLENIGSWPNWAKAMMIGIVCMIVVLLFYFFAFKPMGLQVTQAKLEMQDLRDTYEVKYHQAANLPEYKAQIIEVKKLIVNMLGQLPKTLDVPNLIEDISKKGIAAGLHFKSIRPQPEIERDFYTELPIEIIVTGSYNQIASFISNLANLQRIVTLDDFKISRNNQDMDQLRQDSQNRNKSDLTMELIAKTYKQSSAFKKTQQENKKAGNQ